MAGRTSGGLRGNSNAGGYDAFLVKYSTAGAQQWLDQLGTAYDEDVSGVAVDVSGNVYLAGVTQGGLEGNASAGYSDLFLSKFNSSGVAGWTKQLGTASADSAAAVAADPAGYAYVTGTTKGGLYGNTNSGGEDVFLARYLQ